MGMEESLFPHIRAIKSDDDHEMEEERRICYVAITRAEEVLYITHATSRMLYGRSQSNMPSRFYVKSEDLLETPSKQQRQTITPKLQPNNLSVDLANVQRLLKTSFCF